MLTSTVSEQRQCISEFDTWSQYVDLMDTAHVQITSLPTGVKDSLIALSVTNKFPQMAMGFLTAAHSLGAFRDLPIIHVDVVIDEMDSIWNFKRDEKGMSQRIEGNMPKYFLILLNTHVVVVVSFCDRTSDFDLGIGMNARIVELHRLRQVCVPRVVMLWHGLCSKAGLHKQAYV